MSDCHDRKVINNGNFFISTEKNHLDEEVIFDFLHNRSYWAKGIKKDVFKRSLLNTALCFGVFEGDPLSGQTKQIGFARVISDLATFAYLADVFILEEYRGRGLGKWLVQTIVEHDSLQGVRRFMLATFDAHNLYSCYGFKPLHKPEIYMEVIKEKK